MIELKGITWNHTRGFLPMVATAQRYSELHPGINIHWEKRSLQHFADFPISQLAEKFDLLVLDHPSIGMAAENGLLLPLDTHLEKDFLADQARLLIDAILRTLWIPWRAGASLLRREAADTMLGIFGPLGLVAILGLLSIGVVLCYTGLYWATSTHVGAAHPGSFGDCLYFSAGAFVSAAPRSVLVPRLERSCVGSDVKLR